MRNAIITITAGLMLIAFTSGCASWTSGKPKDKNSMWTRMQFWKKPYQRPQKMAAIWTHDILTMTAKPPTRGFGGRIYFYNEKSQAIPVDGELVVHGYEESRSGRQITAERTEADKTFVFTAEQFTEHFSSSELGASYSVWIPWDAADGMQKEITLIPTFKGTDGSLVQGEPAKLMLPGRTVEDPARPTPFQAVSYEQSETPTNAGPLPGGMKTTTIARASKVNRPSKNSTQNVNPPATQTALGYTTEVRYGNSPLTPLAGQQLGAGGQPTSRALSLYPDPAVGGMNAYSGAMTSASYPNVPNPNAPNPNAAYPNASFPSTMPNLQHPGAMPNSQSGQPATSVPRFQSQPTAPTAVPTHMTLGAAGFEPVQPQAVQAAFATQWQPFGQSPIPLIQQPQQSSVQQAGFSQLPSVGQVPTVGQVPGQLPAAQPGQSILNR